MSGKGVLGKGNSMSRGIEVRNYGICMYNIK